MYRQRGVFRRYINVIIYIRRLEAITKIQKWWRKKKRFEKEKKNNIQIDYSVLR